jgi:hypothetical protein
VQREKARQGPAGDNRSTQEELDQLTADQGRSAGDGGTDAEPPVGILIPAQDLAAERYPQGTQEEAHPDDPGQLS